MSAPIWTPRQLTPAIPKITTFGDSYGIGVHLANRANRATSKLGNLVGCATAVEQANNFSVDGAKLTTSGATQGGWATLMRQALLNLGSVNALSPLIAVVLRYGVNDIAQFGPLIPGNALDLMWRAVMECCLSALRASKWIAPDDASITLAGGQWGIIAGASPDLSIAADGNLPNTSAGVTNSTVTIALPSTFPGGTFAYAALGGSNQTATWAAAVDGASKGSITTTIVNGFDPGSAPYRAMCHRLTGLSAGSHTVNLTLSNIVGTTFLLGAWYEALSAPFVMVADQNIPIDYSAYGGTEPHVPLDSDLSNLNAATRAVAGKFTDGRVLTDGAESLIPRTAAYWTADKLHPSEISEGILATRWAQQLPAAMANAHDLGALMTL